MDLYATTYIVDAIIALVIFSAIAFCGFMLLENTGHELLGAIIVTVGLIADVILVIYLVISIFGSFEQRKGEQVKYQASLMQQQTIQQIVDTTEDIINTDIYMKAIEFNTNLAEIQAAQIDPFYSISFSGNVDWSTVPFVNLG